MATTSTAMIQAFRQQAKNEEEVQDQSKATKPVRSKFENDERENSEIENMKKKEKGKENLQFQ
jgi:hypothetical protein